METVAGIFLAREEATSAAQQLQALGFKGEDLILLSPDAPSKQVAAIPTEAAETGADLLSLADKNLAQ